MGIRNPNPHRRHRLSLPVLLLLGRQAGAKRKVPPPQPTIHDGHGSTGDEREDETAVELATQPWIIGTGQGSHVFEHRGRGVGGDECQDEEHDGRVWRDRVGAIRKNKWGGGWEVGPKPECWGVGIRDRFSGGVWNW